MGGGLRTPIGRPALLGLRPDPSSPGAVCPRCRSVESQWSALPGTGTVFTFTVVRQAFIPALTETIPYVVAALDLDGAGGADGIGSSPT